MSELTTERITEIEKRRAETKRHPIDSDEYDEAWDYFYSDAPRYVDELLEEVWRLRARVAELEAPREGILAAAQALRHAYEWLRNEFVSVCEELEAEQHDNKRLREIMAWLGKGKMRPMERRYQAFLRHDAEHGYDDTPPDYVEWLEQIASGDIHLVEAPNVNTNIGQEGD